MTETTDPNAVAEAIGTWTLTKGTAGSITDQKACAMSLVSYVRTGKLTDHPECAHKTLTDLVIRAFDDEHTTTEQMAAITLAADTGAIDTWWIPATVTVLAHAYEGEADKDDRSLAQLCLDVLAGITYWKVNRPVVDLRYANLGSADLRYALNLEASIGIETARGNQYTKLPAGWTVDEQTRLIHRPSEAQA